MRIFLALILMLVALPAKAEEIVAGLSQSRVSITARFEGSEILIYGAVKREAPPPEGKIEVIVTVEGPSTPLVIRRKERVAGIWINTDKVRIDLAPSFYAVATTGALDDILTETEDLRHGISIPRTIRAVGITAEAPNAPDFVEALQRIRLGNGSYGVSEHSVQLTEETLFRTDVALPANLVEGDYQVRIFLTRGGKVVDHLERVIGVRKAGLERFLYRSAQDQPLFYGLAALALAAFAGWAASAAFRYLRA